MQPKYLALCLLLSLAGCAPPADQSLAMQGRIDETAPVKADVQIVINAPPAHVWTLLTGIQDWPTWNPDIKSVSAAPAPQPGIPFDWSTGSATIHSRLALVEPPHRLSWTGHVLVFHAIHTWTLTPLPNGQTLVQTRESMSGWPIGFFYTSQDLRESDQKWLAALKKKSES